MDIVKNNKNKNIFVNWKEMTSGISPVCFYVTAVDFFNFIKVAIGSPDNSLGFTFDDHCV